MIRGKPVFAVEIPLSNGETETIYVTPPDGPEEYGYTGGPSVHLNDTIFSLDRGEEVYTALDGRVWHIDWRGTSRESEERRRIMLEELERESERKLEELERERRKRER